MTTKTRPAAEATDTAVAGSGMVFALPAYNEEHCIVALVDEILRLYPSSRVIVVDDGSSDATAEKVRDRFGDDQRLTLVIHERNRGLGAAMATLLSTAHKLTGDARTLVSLDADGTHPPQAAARLVNRIDQGADIAVASRYCQSSRVRGVPLHRRLISRVARLLVRLTVGTAAVRDVTCGYRAYSPALLERLQGAWGAKLVERSDFSCQLELLLKALGLGAQCVEEPFELRYDLKQGRSKISFWRTVRSSLALLLSYRLGRLKPRSDGVDGR
ncbi:MAG: glycosyltransferase family 2 protein [Candidatus Alcyoniella australis]|nr:glycosyltransferase family 2 protein [Candidatus Alcyoniella australis]